MSFLKKIFNPNLEPEAETPAENEVVHEDVNDETNQTPKTPEPSVNPETSEPTSGNLETPEPAQDNPETPEPSPSNPETPEPKQTEGLELGDNMQEAVGDLISWIIDALSPLRGGLASDAVHDMTIHVADTRARLIMGETFLQRLRLELDNNLLSAISAGDIGILDGLTDSPTALNVKPGFLQVSISSRSVVVKATGRAIVTIVEGTGSLANPSYELDASAKTVFHIGRGKVVKRGGSIRVNDIVINDAEPDERVLAQNRRVSSSQADILCRDGAFYLKAMPSGCRPEGGAATKVFHNETARELRDTFMPVLLQDGDFIELGGTLLLSFSIVD